MIFNKKKLIILLFAIFSISSYAQVTIGTNEEPVSGSLLQLKNINNVTDGSPNSTKGLGSPRVYLKQQDRLSPMYSYETPANTPSDTDLKEHIGLMVYNLNTCLLNMGFDAGMYVWDGDYWQPLFQTDKKSNNVFSNIDQDGNIFKSRIFKTTKGGGVNAGEWMVENLKAKTYAQTGRTGDDVSIVDQMPTSASLINTSSAPVWSFPGQNGTDASLFYKQPELGLLYNWAAATNSKGKGAVDGSNNNSITNGEGYPGYKGNNAKIQGICPNGWHLPSDDEWNLLEQVIATDPNQFSHYTGTESEWYTWNPAWNTTFGYRPASKPNSNSNMTTSVAHGNAMKQICPAIDYTGNFPVTFGKSLASYKGGFAALMAGYTNNSSNQDYGTIAYMHSSTSAMNNEAITRMFYNEDAGVNRKNERRTSGLSVRCKKDDTTGNTQTQISLSCPTTSVHNILVGEIISSYTIPYTSTTPGAVIPAYTATDNGITVSHPSVTLSASGNISVTVTGNATTAKNSVFNVAIGSQVCPLTIIASAVSTFTLNCAAIPVVNNIKPALPIPTGTIVSVPYTSTYNVGSVNQGDNVIDGTTSINGITASIVNTTSIGAGSGSIAIKLGGTPLNLINSTKIPIKIFNNTCEITVNMIDLADGDLPNAYIVKPGTKYTFPVTKPYLVWQNEPGLRAADNWDMQSVAAGEKAEVLWSESSTSTASPTVTLNGNGKYATITIDATNMSDETNAFVAYFDGTTTVNNLSKTVPAIRWSYHIWITNYDPDNKTNGTTYSYDDSNPDKQIMDRNLGALGGIYLNHITTVDAQGLLYQWGRKDPFPYVKEANKIPGQTCGTCTFIPTISNFGAISPLNLSNGDSTPYLNLAATLKSIRTNSTTGKQQFPIYYYGSGQPFDWMLNPFGTSSNPNAVTVFNLWSKPKGTLNTVGGEVPGKGYYDPCPTGWRVPDDISVFSKITTPNGTQVNVGNAITTPIGNFPMPGSTSSSNATITGEGAGGWGVYWTGKTGTIIGNLSTSNIGGTALELKLQGAPTYTYKSNTIKMKSSFGSVRCIKNL